MSIAPVRLNIEDGIAHIVLDDPGSSVNTMTDAFSAAIAQVVDEVLAAIASDRIEGTVVSSAKQTFFAGGDLNGLRAATKADAPKVFAMAERVKAPLRRLETSGRPVVAAINGAALGGGLEIALAAHHRIAVEGRYDIGLPEVTLGLLPGGGGVTRTVRMLGLQKALLEILVPGRRMKPAAASEIGLVDELVPTREDLLPAAIAWIRAHTGDPEAAVQPWDRDGYRMPGGTPAAPALAAMLPAFPAHIRAQLKGAPYRAPALILAAAVEGAQVDVDTASRIESRYLTELAVGQQSTNMITALFFDLNAVNGGASRPADIPVTPARRLAVIGAGMMGAGIAYVAARNCIEVVVKDVTVEAAARGKAYSEKLLARQVAQGRLAQEQADEILARIEPTADYAALAGADVVVEAVFESEELKKSVFADVERAVLPDALLGSNTSTLPITGLATGVQRPEDFIGIHFFSPVDKMPLVELIVGERTSPAALARAIDFARQIRKTPIVVNDSRGFYTSRVIGTFINEGLAMLAEGVTPQRIERATSQAGFPAPVLQLTDELNLKLFAKVTAETRAATLAAGRTWVAHPGAAVVEAMLAADRPGRLEGAGFYDYVEGRRRGLWPGLAERFPAAPEQPAVRDLADRLVFIQSLESCACLEEGVITSVADANVGSILGIGFPAIYGGTLQLIDGYESPDGTIGPRAFVRRADELADAYGERFRPTPRLRALAESGRSLAEGGLVF